MHDPADPRDVLLDELTQCRESGREVAHLEAPIAAALARSDATEVERLIAELQRAPIRGDWGYEEPSELEDIVASRGAGPPLAPVEPDHGSLPDRIHAAWLGRCAGCNLGKPLEGVDRDAIRRYLEAAEAYPLEDYVPPPEANVSGVELNASWPETVRGRIAFMARDDDTDYTILALHVLETRGFGFGAADVGRAWLERLPYLRVYTAERAAYRNLVLGLQPPEVARQRNPYREWIGAQIRADMFGYVSPGNPARAAELAFRDAALSHVANGIYGAMWAAALIAACFTASSTREALDAAAALIPRRSRLAEALHDVDRLHAAGLDWEAARDELEARYGALSWVHTINNAAAVAAGLLWGDGDFARTVGLAVQAGWDTDCDGATAGSAFGALHGTGALPARWIDPLGDRVRSAIFGYEDMRISELARRTHALALAHRGA